MDKRFVARPEARRHPAARDKPKACAPCRWEDGFKNALKRGVYAASTWKNERFRISYISFNFDREAA